MTDTDPYRSFAERMMHPDSRWIPEILRSMITMEQAGVKLCDPSRYRPEVDKELCKGCGTCGERCWFGAISVEGDGPSAVAAEKCLGCGLCAAACPQGALAMVEVRKPDFIPV